MPGVPGVYYGSEWGITGEKCNGDNTLRPAIEKPEHNELTDWITALANAKQKSKALCYGGYRNLLTMPKQLNLKENVIQKELSLLLILTAMYIMLILMQDREKQLI